MNRVFQHLFNYHEEYKSTVNFFLTSFYRCVICELFTEGTPPFDFSQLLAYRNGEYSPWKVLEKIDDSYIRVGQDLYTVQECVDWHLMRCKGKNLPCFVFTPFTPFPQWVNSWWGVFFFLFLLNKNTNISGWI